ncbi:hypothetical protein TRFO_15477 [Tritrichomonas foetus]|uniref:C2 domain-containing protein n=1 Tax=Tritrichomonas foetus TaxID=1144522 RepID=A0A1J4KSD1_9EUKA|nr:hypothetical protein TRFO_15477 [Tritrichomonas foetus]|eukprot:OHT14191.1 hypothetical protein TRFO_15477 [Tritrichomonas foetus]
MSPNIKIKNPKMGKTEKIKLYICVQEARTLLPSDINGWSDPFCTVEIGINNKYRKLFKTPVIKRTLNPRWNCNFVYMYNVEEDNFESTLRFKIFDNDTLTLSDLLGYVEIPLENFRSYEPVEEWYKLKNEDKHGNKLRVRGYIKVLVQALKNGQDFNSSKNGSLNQTIGLDSQEFNRQQKRMDAIAAAYHMNEQAAASQLRQNEAYRREVQNQARSMNAQMAANPGQPPAMAPDAPVAPHNQQFDILQPGYQSPAQEKKQKKRERGKDDSSSSSSSSSSTRTSFSD